MIFFEQSCHVWYGVIVDFEPFGGFAQVCVMAKKLNDGSG